MRQVIVTGGGTGIGRAVAAAFAGAGEQAVITGRRAAVLKETAVQLGPGVRGVAFDAADPAQIEAALADLPSQVDVLVNCAGGNTDIGAAPPAGLAGLAAAWRANLDANVLTAVLVTEALRPRLAPGGTVINISSIAAHRPGRPAGRPRGPGPVPGLPRGQPHHRPGQPRQRRRPPKPLAGRPGLNSDRCDIALF